MAQRQAYDSVLAQADVERQRGDFGKAEELLSGLLQGGRSDDRLTAKLAEVQDERISHAMTDAERVIGRGEFDRGIALLEALRLRATPAWTARVEEARQAAIHKKEEFLRERFRRVRARVVEGAPTDRQREQMIVALNQAQARTLLGSRGNRGRARSGREWVEAVSRFRASAEIAGLDAGSGPLNLPRSHPPSGSGQQA